MPKGQLTTKRVKFPKVGSRWTVNWSTEIKPAFTVVRIHGNNIFYAFDQFRSRGKDGLDVIDISLWYRLTQNGDIRPQFNGIERAKKVLSRRDAAARSGRGSGA